MAKIDDIVNLTNVSRSTVFRFFNGQNIRADARNSIIKAMKELNYRMDDLYKYLNIEIEISISSNFESFQGFTQVVEGIASKADEKGVKVNIARRPMSQMDSDYSNWNESSTYKGVIVVGKNTEDTLYEAKAVSKYKIPHVFVNRLLETEEYNYVSVDLQKAAYDIVSYLINKGHKDIAVIGCPNTSQVDMQKLAGYRSALKNHNISVNKDFYYEIPTMDDWETTAKKLLTLEHRPSAFFAICDSHAIKFNKMVNDMGLNVPKDIAIVGMDDIDICKFVHPALTTVHIPFYKMGAIAVENLLKIITDDDIETMKTIVKHSIITRESCSKQ